MHSLRHPLPEVEVGSNVIVGRLYNQDWLFIPYDGTEDIKVSTSAANMTYEFAQSKLDDIEKKFMEIKKMSLVKAELVQILDWFLKRIMMKNILIALS